MNWGRGIALSLIAFAAMMATFLVIASRHVESLVTDEYYAEELKYQERIDAQARARSLSAPVVILVQGEEVALRFPEELAGLTISGTLTLLRPNDANGDRSVEFEADAEGRFRSDGLRLLPGRYDASVDWRSGGVSYHSSDKLVVQ